MARRMPGAIRRKVRAEDALVAPVRADFASWREFKTAWGAYAEAGDLDHWLANFTKLPETLDDWIEYELELSRRRSPNEPLTQVEIDRARARAVHLVESFTADE